MSRILVLTDIVREVWIFRLDGKYRIVPRGAFPVVGTPKGQHAERAVVEKYLAAA